MDGSVGREDLVFLVYFSKTTQYITLIFFSPPMNLFKVSVVKKFKINNNSVKNCAYFGNFLGF